MARSLRRVVGLLILSLCLAAQFQAHGAGIPSVAVAHAGTDPVGVHFGRAVRDAVRASMNLTLGEVGLAQFEISMVTIDPEANTANEGNWTVAAIVFLARDGGGSSGIHPHSGYPLFLTGLVLRVGRHKMDEGAQRILANLEKEIQKFGQEGRSTKEEAPALEASPRKEEPHAQEGLPTQDGIPAEGVAPREEALPNRNPEPRQEATSDGGTAPDPGVVPLPNTP